jgi:hypothetical protein
MSLDVFMMMWLRTSFFRDVTCHWAIISLHFAGKVSSKHRKIIESYEHTNVWFGSKNGRNFLTKEVIATKE